jgi:cardiolipin synthase
VGSSNIDPFSLLLAREANVVVDDREFAGQLRASLLALIEQGARPVVRSSWSKQPLAARVLAWASYGIFRVSTGLLGYSKEQESA